MIEIFSESQNDYRGQGSKDLQGQTHLVLSKYKSGFIVSTLELSIVGVGTLGMTE